MDIRIAACAGLLLLGSCGGPKEKPAQVVRPVKIYTVESLSHVDKDFAGMSTADSITNLAFRVTGQLIKINVIEGQSVGKGEVIAEIDPRQYRLQMEAAKAEYLTSQSQLERSKRLIAKQAVSQQDYEIAQANFVQAQAAYENALSLLTDTRLRAPFSGAIEKMYADNFQQVQQGQEIARLVNPVTRSVKFTMPETALQTLKLPAKQFTVIFDNYKGVAFPALLKEYVQSSTQATGIAVTLTLTGVPPQYNIAPGMSCTINLKVDNPGYEGVTAVPITAVYSVDGQKKVWVVTGGAVMSKDVQLGELFGTDMAIVETGLHPGEDVVTAGVYQLVEGEKVKILK